jgi:anthranilate phosphoribosyltransferase
MVIGYYHLGYEKKLLQLMWDRGFQVGLAIKGEEGTSHYALRLSSPSTLDRQAVNYSQGFQRVNDQREDFSLDLDPQNFGFNYQKNPRLKIVSPKSFATAGMSALSGQKGHVYDRLVLNTAMTDYLLGFYSDPDLAVKSVKRAIDSGQALSHLKTYIAKSQTM